MLPKNNRLKKRKDFQKVMRRGKGLREDFLFLKFLKNNLKVVRVGFIVSQKIAKKATQRNKIKRRLREGLREKLAQIKKGYDLIFIAQKGIEKKKFSEIKEKIDQLLKRAKILKNDQKLNLKID